MFESDIEKFVIELLRKEGFDSNIANINKMV